MLSTQPPSGTLIANFEGTENVITLICNISGDGSNQIGTTWSIANYRGSITLVDITGGPEPFDVGGPPNPLAPQVSLSNELTISNWTADLDGATIFCGTGIDQQEASFSLRVYRKSLFCTICILHMHGTKNKMVGTNIYGIMCVSVVLYSFYLGGRWIRANVLLL